MVTRTLLIDGDILIYKAAFGAESVHEFDEGIFTSTADFAHAQDHFETAVARLTDKLKADAVVVALTDDVNWRKAIYPEYKAPRGKVRRPILLKPLKEWVATAFTSFTRPTLEADDVLGILCTGTKIKGEKVICTIDKDLLQIPGKHYHLDKETKKTVTVKEGDYLHMTQTLTGDPVDNYPGLPGCGPVKAKQILGQVRGEHVTMWEAVTYAYTQKGLTVDDALVQARVARICRAEDYDFTRKSVRLWQPTLPL